MKEEKAFHKKAIAANDHIQLALADLLELLSLKYCQTPNIVKPGEALCHVLVKEILDNNLKKKLVEKFERSKIFQPNINPLQFLTFIDIKSLDVPILKKLLKKVPCFPTSRRRTCPTLPPPNKVLCCGKCFHPCPLCTKEDCQSSCPNSNKPISWNHPCTGCLKEKTDCISEHCANCGNLADQCGISNSSDGIDFLKENRNIIFHSTLEEIRKFIKGTCYLQGFRNEKSLFKHILRNYVSIINFLANRNHFEGDAITFVERRKRIDELTAILFRESEVSDNLSRQCLFLTEQMHSMQEKIESFQMEESCNRLMSVYLETCSKSGCKLLVQNVNVTEVMKLRIRQIDLHDTEEFIEEDDCNILGKGNSSILDIKHNVVKNYKYHYEIIFEDDINRRWKSCYNHDPSHANLLWLKDDQLDFLVTSPNSVEISELQSVEKVEGGFKSKLQLNGEYSTTKLVETKQSQSNEWKRWKENGNGKENTFTTEPQEDNRCTFECTFDECDVYDIRCLVETKDGRYHLFTMDKIAIVGEGALEHQRSVDDVSLILHPIGDNNDSFETLQNVLAGKSIGGGTSTTIFVRIKSPGGGLVTGNLSKMGSYIDQNYKHQPYICFPPLYMVTDATRMATVFDIYLRKKEGRFILLPTVNLLNCLQTLRYSTQQIHELFRDNLQLNSVCNILFDMDNATVYVTTPCESVHHLMNAYQQSDRNMKALLTITQDLYSESLLTFVGVVGCFNSSKGDLEKSDSFCRSCSHLIITSNDIQSEQSVFKWLSLASEETKKKQESQFSDNNTTNDSMKLLADRLMILAAVEDYSLPSTCVATDNQKLERLVLTLAQIDAVFDEKYKQSCAKS